MEGVLGKFERRFSRTVKLTNTHKLTKLRHSQTLTDTHPRMSTVDFTVTFSTQDILRDPQVRKALRAREDAYLNNLARFDEDLKNNKKELM